MKKKAIISTLLSLMLTFGFPSFISAVECTDPSATYSTNAVQSVAPRVEETEWYYFTINGRPYKRLWSITKGIWLTDPIPVV